MHRDMHYNATFCLAYAAGFSTEHAVQIATSCQFVDDNKGEHALIGDKTEVEFEDGASVYLTPTAHHAPVAGVRAIANVDEEQQSSIWVPFHFLPGNVGSSFQEKMITTKNSPLSREMIEHALEKADKPYALQLLGITAHVYADTFAHYGFSGLKSDLNNVVGSSIAFNFKFQRPEIEKYVEDKANSFVERFWDEVKDAGMRFASKVGELAQLGHGAVFTYPDRPYMKWSFEYEEPRQSCTQDNDGVLATRNNPVDYLEACEALYGVFKDFLEKQPIHKGVHTSMPFSSIEAKAKDIIETEGTKEDRCELWEKAFVEGDFGGGGGRPFPKYLGDDWEKEIEQADGQRTAEKFLATDVFKFYQAAEQHRAFVLRELLPKHGLIVK